SGFANPPEGKPFLALHLKSAEGAAERAAEVLQSIREVQTRLATEPISSVPELFGLAETFACCLPEFDPYRAVREKPALGPVQALPKPLPVPAERRVFGYLNGDDPRLPRVLEYLVRAKVS